MQEEKCNKIQPQERIKTTVLPYMKGSTDKIGKAYQKYKIKIIFKPHRKIKQYQPSVKDKIKLQNP